MSVYCTHSNDSVCADRIRDLEARNLALSLQYEAAEARCAELTTSLKPMSDKVRELAEQNVLLEARAKVAEDLLRDWLKAYDDCGPDNGPSFSEHECAVMARVLLKCDLPPAPEGDV